MQIIQIIIGWTNLAIVSLLLLFMAKKSYSSTNWSERQMIWMKDDKNKRYNLKLCASNDNVIMCGNFAWIYPKNQKKESCSVPKKHSCSELVCDKLRVTNSAESCGHEQQFYQDWNNYLCECSSANSTSGTPNTATVASNMTPSTYYSHASSSQSSRSKILETLVAIQAVLLVLVISGWVWTCCIVKKLKKQIKSSQTSNIPMSAVDTNNTTTAYPGYENTPLEDTTCHQPMLHSSTDYSLLQPATKSNSKMNVTGEDALYSDANGPKYHKLDRSNERSKVKTSAPWCQQKGGTENYSVLTYD